MAARRLKERVYLICIVEAGHIAFFLWALYSICRVGRDQIQLHCVLQRFMDDGMIMDHRTAADSLALLQIKLLDVFRSQFLQFRTMLAKIRDNHAVSKVAVGCVGRHCNRIPGYLQPLSQKICKQGLWFHAFRRFLLEIAPCIHQNGFRPLFVSFDCQASGDPFAFSFALVICVVQYCVVMSAFFAEMSRYHMSMSLS